MSRLSSLKCYREIKEGGLLSERRMQAFEALITYGPCTAGELACKPEVATIMTRNDLSSRLHELVEFGVAFEADDMRECSITKHLCLVYDIIDAMPVKPEKEGTIRPSRSALMEENRVLKSRIQQLEERVETLTGPERQIPLFSMKTEARAC